MGVRRDSEIIEKLFSILDESLTTRNGTRYPESDAAFCKAFIRQGVIPFDFLSEIALSLRLPEGETGQFIEDISSICQITGPDLIAREQSVLSRGRS